MSVAIRNILIANRGEIANRILKTLRKKGIRAIGIYSENDRFSPWIRQCNDACNLGKGDLSETYLNIDKIIDAAKKSGADAIHPGYGFLSENFRFAEACEHNNIVFIGPNPGLLKIAGDKLISYKLVRDLGIPVVDKITGSLDALDLSGIKYPVIAKAVAGGGGKGIRVARSSIELKDVIKTVAEEARKSFGDDRIFLEEYIENPRHIEVQILGDKHGNRVHLFERDCSVQRRHQKLIEETPAPNMHSMLRESIIEAALKIAGHIGYDSAGTIEFLVDGDNFRFLEINPRIQVEHGITELVTGVDIISEQINIAEGNKLSFTQDQICFTGNAMELRIYAEDPENDMVPLPGKIHYMSLPGDEDIRIDTGAESGTEIWPEFDPLIAKLLVHGTSREDVLEKMSKALEKSVILGLHHNLELFIAILDDKDFIKGNLSTAWLTQKFDRFADQIAIKSNSYDRIILAITAALEVFNTKNAQGLWNSGYWRNVKQIRFRISDQPVELEYERHHDGITFYHKKDYFYVSSVYHDGHSVKFLLNEQLHKWYTVPERDGIIDISDGHHVFSIERFSLLKKEYEYSAKDYGTDSNTVFAPQPGTIVDVRVSEGQEVNRGDYLLTIESMKLENTIMAVSGGVIQKIHIKAGDKVKKNEPLIHLQ